MKKTALGLGVVALTLAIAGFSVDTASAYKGDPAVKGPNYSVEKHTAMVEAFENKDYISWKNLMPENSRVTQLVNKDNFAKFAEAHALALQGKKEEAQKIRQELGLGLKNGSGKGYDRLIR